jgi:hypothetical protein
VAEINGRGTGHGDDAKRLRPPALMPLPLATAAEHAVADALA